MVYSKRHLGRACKHMVGDPVSRWTRIASEIKKERAISEAGRLAEKDGCDMGIMHGIMAWISKQENPESQGMEVAKGLTQFWMNHLSG